MNEKVPKRTICNTVILSNFRKTRIVSNRIASYRIESYQIKLFRITAVQTAELI